MSRERTYQNEPMGIQRGVYGRNWFWNILFSIGRALTGPVQYLLIGAHPLGRFGIPPPPTGGLITLLGHTMPRYQVLAALMPAFLSVKQIIWINVLAREKLSKEFLLFAVPAGIAVEMVHTLAFTAASKNPLFSSRVFNIGLALFMTGNIMEVIADVQLALHRWNPKNQGKVCKAGLWRVTRQINYTANIIFGFGYTMALGGLVYGIVATTATYIMNFLTNAGPSKEHYCREKYGKQWEQYKKEVPYVLIPWIY
ncbi:hypothetical protein PV08_03739 [Exophiala spinifera]|uniref:Steroid 5-alpha reductase C-terminal domain-containing protein n=1 Tax=Exophiala spinifera TaxID=91928 RepID=A0A0D1YNB3_9EURO|nr:uncharacterized protein PV08_03739 [Exophiala spinifera]KIW16551.1 hypothetical protein PV08_03739 [Exophiala spinifera]